MRNNNLIMDFGMHHGYDTEFYLKKGFSVVAVEANPILTKAANEKFSEYIKSGQLIIENIGIAPDAGKLPFYINEDNDEWSSFDKSIGTRNNTRYTVKEIAVVNASHVLDKYGMPYYLKVDIEGYDVCVVRALIDFVERPKYISIEDSGAHCVTELCKTGVKRLQYLNQLDKWKIKLPEPSREGNYTDMTFLAGSSGPFGEELPGDWLTIEDAVRHYYKVVRAPGMPPYNGWWDIHGVYEL